MGALWLLTCDQRLSVETVRYSSVAELVVTHTFSTPRAQRRIRSLNANDFATLPAGVFDSLTSLREL